MRKASAEARLATQLLALLGLCFGLAQCGSSLLPLPQSGSSQQQLLPLGAVGADIPAELNEGGRDIKDGGNLLGKID